MSEAKETREPGSAKSAAASLAAGIAAVHTLAGCEKKASEESGTAPAPAAAESKFKFEPWDGDPIRIALVGCGGRGNGAAENALHSADKVHLVAMADLFQDKLDKSRKFFAGQKFPGFKATDKDCYTGWDAYKKVFDREDVDLVLLTTPPGFRWMHYEAAVAAGKHCFLEKPVAVDPFGVRKVIEIGKKSQEKKLAIMNGTQYRHQESFIETVKRVHDGAIGKVVSGRAYYNTNPLRRYKRKEGQSDLEWQIRNWKVIDWLDGDQPVEQHLHTIDVTDWMMGARPEKVTAVGGRQVSRGEINGNVWDHWQFDYEYPGGVHVMSMCRQWMNTDGYVGAHFVGELGEADPYNAVITGKNAWSYEKETGKKPDISVAYIQEHADLINSIRAGKPWNEAKQAAESALTAIMGREAAYTGREITWQQISESEMDLRPEGVPLDKFGPCPLRPVPVPGDGRKV